VASRLDMLPTVTDTSRVSSEVRQETSSTGHLVHVGLDFRARMTRTRSSSSLELIQVRRSLGRPSPVLDISPPWLCPYIESYVNGDR
jgi:hypothetical protein